MKWDGCTPLLKAIDHQHEDVVKLLIKSGASLDARDHVSCQIVVCCYVYLFINTMQSFNTFLCWFLQWHGSTAITKASENGQENIVNSLVNAGASLESEDDVCFQCHFGMCVCY